MPIYLRRFYLNKLVETKKEEKKQNEEANKKMNKTSSPPNMKSSKFRR